MADEELLEQIEDLKAQLAVAQAEQWKIIRAVCHDLRLPLTAIKGYVDLMPLIGALSDQQKEFVATIKKNVVRMTGMITHLHELAFIGENTLKMTPLVLPTAHIIKKVCKEMQAEAKEHQNTLTCEVSDDLPKVEADRERAEQSLGIMLDNASRYTPAGGQITVTAHPTDDGFVRIVVADTGVGVLEEERDKLFTLLFRGDIELVRQQPGAGMSLYMLKCFMGLMGGRCGADFPPEGGSSFWIELPIATRDPVQEILASEGKGKEKEVGSKE